MFIQARLSPTGQLGAPVLTYFTRQNQTGLCTTTATPPNHTHAHLTTPTFPSVPRSDVCCPLLLLPPLPLSPSTLLSLLPAFLQQNTQFSIYSNRNLH